MYLADRIIDSRRPPSAQESTRHAFYRRNKVLALGLLATVAVTLAGTVAGLPSSVVQGGLRLGACVAAYLALYPLRGYIFWKQPSAAMLFAAGVFLPKWPPPPQALAFAALCLVNLLLVEQRAPTVRRLLVAGLIQASVLWAPSPWFRAVAVSTVGLGSTEFLSPSDDARSVLADLALLLPLYSAARFEILRTSMLIWKASGLGLRAMGGCKPRQVRKEATVVVQPVCRGLPGACP